VFSFNIRNIQYGTHNLSSMSHVIRQYDTPNGITYKELLPTCSLLLLAGSETTATSLSAVTYFLLSNHRIHPPDSPVPSAYTLLRTSIREAFALDEDITMTSVNSLAYLSAVISEGLRMFPPVPHGFPRVTSSTGEFIAGKYVPPGISVGVSQWATHRSKANFSRPLEFIPERWLGGQEWENDKRNAVQPFHVGPRGCLGRK
jgi:cytochrome P450